MDNLYIQHVPRKGLINTTGMSATEAKRFFGKNNTYHWDDVVDEAGRLLNHAADNIHADMKHLQYTAKKEDYQNLL